MEKLEEFWDFLLSRETEKITIAFQGLSKEEQKNIHNHLKRMVFEEGWLPEQRTSAQIALGVIENAENQ